MTHTLLDIGFALLDEDGSSWNIRGEVVAEASRENLHDSAMVAPRKRGRPKGYKRRDMRVEG